MTAAETDAGLRAVLDEREILRTLHRYLRALDDGLEERQATTLCLTTLNEAREK